MESFIHCEGLVKIYRLANLEVYALQGLDLSIQRGEMVGIVGASGSGKSTLMNILGGLDKPTAGKVWVDGVDLLKLNGADQNHYRSTKVGFVWQQGIRNLVSYLNAEENVVLPMILAGGNIADAEQRARELLEIVGLSKRRLHHLDELSGGEQQRVAIAVGLVNHPQLLLADEPTGEVDSATSAGIFKIFKDLNTNFGVTIVVVSHDAAIARYMDRVVAIRDGRTASETVRIRSTDAAGSNLPAEQGRQNEQYEEIILVDATGRLQLPREYINKLNIKNRVRAELKDGGILIVPVSHDRPTDAVLNEGGPGISPGNSVPTRPRIEPDVPLREKLDPPGVTAVQPARFFQRIKEKVRGWPFHQWLILALILTYLLPIWVFQFIPTQDGPSHLYNSQILAWILDPSSTFRQFFDLRLALFPNWLTYLILGPLMLIFPALIAEKILLSMYVILMPLSVWYLLDAIRPGKTLLTLASFGLIYNYLLLMGFYNFVFSLPLVMFAIGYWWKHRENLALREIILINLLCVLIWFGHIIGYCVALFAIGFLALLQVRSGIRAFLKTLACILPSTLLFINYYLGSDISNAVNVDLSRIPGLLLDLATMKVLVSYDAVQAAVSYTVAALFGYLILAAFWKKLRGKGKWSERFDRQDLFFLLILCLLALYLLLPWSMGPGGWLNDRFALLICLLLLVWFDEAKQKSQRIIFIALSAAVALINVGYIFFAFDHFNTGLKEFTSGTQIIEKGKVILPFFFKESGESARVGVYVNAANYYALDNGGINLGNYEVQFDYFPIRFKNSFVPPVNDKEWVQMIHWQPQRINICGYASQINYLETWGKADITTFSRIAQCYSKIFENGSLRIYVPNGND